MGFSRILFISNIPWEFVWQRHQTLASLFAEDSPVVYCEIPGTRRIRISDFGRLIRRAVTLARSRSSRLCGTDLKNITIVRPILLPATNRMFCAWNKYRLAGFTKVLSRHDHPVDLIINYSASRSALDLIGMFPSVCVIYDCTDDWLAVAGVPEFLARDEAKLLARSDLTLVPSRVLYERKRTFARKIKQVPHGALVDRFLMEPKTSGGSCTLLYYGHLHRQHLDFEAIVEIASARPSWNIILVGPVKTRGVFPGNVKLVGQQRHEDLRKFIEGSDVLILPYAINNYTKAVFPAKSFECLATGRPVVASPLPELERVFTGTFSFARSRSDWVPEIERAVASDCDELRAKRISIAQRNSWRSRYAEIQAMIKAL
jgi:glycosyltransferase involved in cell wall biosynthesis